MLAEGSAGTRSSDPQDDGEVKQQLPHDGQIRQKEERGRYIW